MCSVRNTRNVQIEERGGELTSRSVKVPAWYLRHYPRYRGERLEHFLDDVEALGRGEERTFGSATTTTPWRGYDKTPSEDQDKIFTSIRKLVTRKAENLDRIRRETRRATALIGKHRGKYTSKRRVRKGRVIRPKEYTLVYDEYIYIRGKPRWKDSVTGRFTKFDSKRAEYGEIYPQESGGRWYSTAQKKFVPKDEVYNYE